jgi:hypothetical protein
MAMTLDECKELTGKVVDLRIGRGVRIDQRSFTCRVVSVETNDGVDMVYVQPSTRPDVGLALPIKHVRSMTPVAPVTEAPLAPTTAG